MMKAAVLCFAVAAAVSAQERPAVFWWSAPVEPGELVQVAGGNWGDAPTVEVAGVRVRPVRVTETGICFEVPKTLGAGLAACRVVGAGGAASEAFILNEPAVWWTQGDLGADASPGGWLRLFGRCLDRGGKAKVVLEDGGRRVELKLTKRDGWSLDAAVPGDLREGRYAVRVSNGAGGRDGWREAGRVAVRRPQAVWKPERFDVTAFGAVPNDGLDDTLALQAALAQAATNGGGVVYLPRGRFQCNGTLQIPPNTLLRGESRESTALYWPDCEEPPENLIEGTTAFGIEDLFIHSGKYRNGIVCKNASAGQHELGGGIAPDDAKPRDISLRRVRLKLVIDQYLIKNTAEYEKRAYLRGNGIVIRDAYNVNVEDCDIYTSKEGSTTLFFVLSADYLHIRNCRINGSGWAVVGGDRVIFENNGAHNCTYSIAPVCRRLFWSGNTQYDLFTNNRESITHDGARTAFRGLLPAACEGTRLALDFGAEKVAYRNGPGYWVGQNVQLVEGRGAGQTRTVAAIDGNVVTLDRAWDVTPDATSRFVVAAERRHLIYADNFTEDSSVAIQLYGGLTEGALVRNRCARAGGFRGFGMDYRAIIPLWYVQFIGNEILEGNGYRGPSNQMVPLDAELAILDHGRGMDLTRSCVMRGNTLHNNARVVMSCANGIIENNLVKNADMGIAVEARHAASIVLRGNRFENVAEPLDATARQRAVMHPAGRVLALLAGAEAALGSGTPAAWEALKRRLAASVASATWDARDEAAARDALLAALRALSAATPEGAAHDLRVAESLLGASLRIQDWDRGMTALLGSPAASEADVRLLAGLAPDAPSAACAVVFGEVPGWRFPERTAAALTSGATVTLDARLAAPEGPKGFFRLPATVTYSGDGWTLPCRAALRTLTQNRLCQWAADAGQGWKPVTNTTVHGQMELGALLGDSPTGTTVTAMAILRVARPTPVRFEFEGPVRVTLDGTRIGTDIQRGRWGTAALAPGDHVLKAVFTRQKSGESLFKVACETADTCLPGDLLLLPAGEVVALNPAR